ncbi:MAG: hypothetical protein IJO04_02100 [Oscillospiraceae bacterium]|nr:hypothetical protein [Oscillospiraceae bacterium]
MMEQDAFGKCHPAVNFLFFVGAIGFGVLIQHPVYLAAGALCAGIYYMLLHGAQGWKRILQLLPLFVLLTLINPLFNIQGERVLFDVFGRPYTLEALIYGADVAGIFVVMLLWFGCYNRILTGDKFTSLFGNWIPAISLLLVMVFRMVPGLMGKSKQIAAARRSVGKGVGTSTRQKLDAGMAVLSALISWALEGSVVTGDSMRARGYGTAKRTSFQLYRMTVRDGLLLATMMFLGASVIGVAVMGGMGAEFTPRLQIAPVSGWSVLGLAAYCLFLLIPTAMHCKEALQWSISKLKI